MTAGNHLIRDVGIDDTGARVVDSRGAGVGEALAHDAGGSDSRGDAGPVAYAQRLLKAGDPVTARILLERVLPTLTGYERARGLVLRVVAIYNGGPPEALGAAVDEAFEAVRERPEPYLHGHLCALAALAAHRRGELEQAVTYLVRSSRDLSAVPAPDESAVWGWVDLAMAYSYLGFHSHAFSTHQHALRVARDAGISDPLLLAPGVRLRGAVLRDHEGDTESCVRILTDLVAQFCEQCATGVIQRVRPGARLSWAYAAARLAALGEPVEVDARPYLTYHGESIRNRDLAVLGEVCMAIGDGRPMEALRCLDGLTVSPETLGPGEVARLCALAYVRLGDFRRAYEADRHAFRLASARGEHLREKVVEGIAARVESERLRRRVAEYADAARTDPLTGLPNRRHLEEYVTDMVRRGGHAVVGVCDMDGFKAVNEVHGHLMGDLVLQRVGEIIGRVLRRGDFLARYGGDEFVLVLPETTLAEARGIAQRVIDAVEAADWSAVVPGTPVSVSIGLAQVAGPRLEPSRVLGEAFEVADRAMLEAKVQAKRRLRERLSA